MQNPYAPPSAEADVDLGAVGRGGNLPLAGRGARWVGAVLDTVFAVGAAFPGTLFASQSDIGLVIVFGGFLFVMVIQAYLISTTGQSIAKRLLRMRIVREDGSPPGFVHGVLLRSWLVTCLNAIPGLGTLFGLVDGAMVFRADRRCLHDLIAGTIVIQVLPGGAAWAPGNR